MYSRSVTVFVARVRERRQSQVRRRQASSQADRQARNLPGRKLGSTTGFWAQHSTAVALSTKVIARGRGCTQHTEQRRNLGDGLDPELNK